MQKNLISVAPENLIFHSQLNAWGSQCLNMSMSLCLDGVKVIHYLVKVTSQSPPSKSEDTGIHSIHSEHMTML